MHAQRFEGKSIETPLHEVGDVKDEEFPYHIEDVPGLTVTTDRYYRMHYSGTCTQTSLLLMRSLKSTLFRRRNDRATRRELVRGNGEVAKLEASHSMMSL